MVRYAVRRALKLFSFLFLPFFLVALLLQLSVVQNFLFSYFFRNHFETVVISPTKGFFPFGFSLESARFESKSKKIVIENFSVKFKKNLIGIKQLSIDNVIVKNFEKTKFSLPDIALCLPFIKQRFLKNVNIKSVQINENKIEKIKYIYDKKTKIRNLSLSVNQKDCVLSYSLNQNSIAATFSINDFQANVNFEIPRRHINIQTSFSKNETLNFDGILFKSKLAGILSSSKFQSKTSLTLTISENILNAKFFIKNFDTSGELSYDFEKERFFANGIVIGHVATIKPFFMDDNFHIENVDILLKNGKINIEDIFLLKKDFSIGKMKIAGVGVCDFLDEPDISGELSGDASFSGGKGLFELQLQKVGVSDIPLPNISIKGEYSKDKIVVLVGCNVLKKLNKINFEVEAKNWTVEKNSKIKLSANGSFNITKRGKDGEFSGSLLYILKANGNFDDPKFAGNITFKDGIYVNVPAGVFLKKINAKATLKDRTIEIGNISAIDDTSNPGKISGNGFVDIISGKTLLKASIDNLRLVDIPNFKGRVFGDISVEGESFKVLKIFGKLHSNDAKFDISSIITQSNMALGLIENQESVHTKQKSKLNLPDIPIDIEFSFKPDLKIVGFGVDSRWNGGAKLSGSLDRLFYESNLDLINGKIKVSGNEFKLSNGRIWANSETPDVIFVDVVATKSVSGIKVRARFVQDQKGTEVKFESTPYLSQNDILSYMLFDHSSSEISTGEAFTLFSVMSALSGNKVMDIMSKIKSVLGIDSIELKRVTDDDKEYDALSVGKKIGKMKVSVDQGNANDTTKAVLDAKIAKNTKLSVDLYGKNAPGVGIFWNKRY